MNNAASQAQKARGESFVTLIASLSTAAIVNGLQILVFVVMRRSLPGYYVQRSRFMKELRSSRLRDIFRKMIHPIAEPQIRTNEELDQYLFERYLHSITRIFLPLAVLISPVLLPLNYLNGEDSNLGVYGLDRFTFANVGSSHNDRYWAHLTLGVVLILFVCLIIRSELNYFHKLLHSSKLLQSRVLGESTLLLVINSKEEVTQETIRRRLDSLFGGVRKITYHRDLSDLSEKVKQRAKLVDELEQSVSSSIKRAVRSTKSTSYKASGKRCFASPSTTSILDENRASIRLPRVVSPRLPPIPCVGTKVDATKYYRDEIVRYNAEIEHDQVVARDTSWSNTMFIEFNGKITSHLHVLQAQKCVPSSWAVKPLRSLDDIIWENVGKSWSELCFRSFLVYILIIAFISVFAFPVMLTGFVSQIVYLARTIPWLAFTENLPTWVMSTIQGSLPSLFLALIMLCTPYILRMIVSQQGLHSYHEVEKLVQRLYFSFLFIQIVMFTTLSAGISTVWEDLLEGSFSITTILDSNLPKASNYFFSYIMVHSLTASTGALTQLMRVINRAILSPLLDTTPRQKWLRERTSSVQNWGTFLPIFTNLACIGLVYSVVAPLILTFSALSFGAIWIVYRYNSPILSEHGLASEGMFYPTAIRQLFTGIYLMELCMIGLFCLIRDNQNNMVCLAQAILMMFVMGLTVIFHFATHNRSLWSLVLSNIRRNRQKLQELHVITSEHKKDIHKVDNPDLQDQVLLCRPPIIWIPKDEYGFADEEIYLTKETSDSLLISSQGAHLDSQGRLSIDAGPPDTRG